MKQKRVTTDLTDSLLVPVTHYSTKDPLDVYDKFYQYITEWPSAAPDSNPSVPTLTA